jgi:protein TonB
MTEPRIRGQRHCATRGSTASPVVRRALALATEPELVPLDEFSTALKAATIAPHRVRGMDEVDADLNGRPPRERRSRALTITLAVSLGLHLAALTAVLLLLRGGAPLAEGPENPATVELVMVEHMGEPHPEAAPPTRSQAPATAEKLNDASAQSPESAADILADAPPDTQQAAADTPAKARPPGVTITLHGTDSPSDARAWGDRVIPAAPDAVFHNRPPEYPEAAAMNGEHGTVVVLIHIAPSGRTASVDVTRSSGFVLLDQAARDAVSRWRFLPAVKDGQPVVSSMQMGFVFSLE